MMSLNGPIYITLYKEFLKQRTVEAEHIRHIKTN